MNSIVNSPPVRGEAREAAASLLCRCVVHALAAIDEAASRAKGARRFKSVQDWIHDALAEGNSVTGRSANFSHDLVAIYLVVREKPEQQQLRDSRHEWR